MNAVPAVSPMSGGVPSPVASTPAQTTTPGTTSQFQDLYQNLPSMQNPSQEAGQQTDAKNAAVKKKLAADATAVAAAPAATNNGALPKAPLTLALALGLPTQPAVTASQQLDPISARASESTTPLPGEGVEPSAENLNPAAAGLAKSASGNEQNVPLVLPGSSVPAAPIPAPILPSKLNVKGPQRASASQTQAAPADQPVPLPIPSFYSNAVPVEVQPPSSVPNESGLRADLPATSERSDKLPLSSAPGNGEAPAGTSGQKSIPLNAENFAFSVQLADAAGKQDASSSGSSAAPTLVAKPVQSAVAQALTEITLPASQTVQPQAAGAASRTSAGFSPGPGAATHSLPKISVVAQEGRPSGQSDSSPRQSSGQSEPGTRDATNVTKPEATGHRQFSEDAETLAPAAPAMHASSIHAMQADSTAWFATGTVTDPRPSANPSPQQTPSLPAVAPPPEIQQVNVPTITTNSNEILLSLGDGQNSAAVRVVDRAGTVTVSVHATDQDLRNSLRSNLGELSNQLNTQGIRTEVVKTASAQPASENRPQQGGQEQRNSGQQQSFSQNDRQSQRERRANVQWLDELAQQTSTNTGQPGGSKS
jgi:hypothetical protein